LKQAKGIRKREAKKEKKKKKRKGKNDQKYFLFLLNKRI
jgi:hypothetical protein